MKSLFVAAALFAGCCVQPVLAANQAAPLKLDLIATQQREIRAEVMAGAGRYKNMSRTTRDELLTKQERLLRMIDGKQDPQELSEEQRLEAFNTLEWIEATINKEADEQLVCARERKTGSNRITRVCRTRQEIEERRERARRQMEGSAPIDI